MSEARQAILDAVRSAIADVPRAEEPRRPVPLATRTGADVDLLADRLRDYGAGVARVPDDTAVAGEVERILARHAVKTAAIPVDLPTAWRPRTVELRVDAPPLPLAAIESAGAAVTAAGSAIAATGTLVLDGGPGQGRRLLSLLPDLHVCVLATSSVLQSVPAAVERLAGVGRPLTMVSGPSATSDIELKRVEGVHGPRRLEVILIGVAEAIFVPQPPLDRRSR